MSAATIVRGQRHTVLTMCFLAMFIAYTDRVNISVAVVAMREQFTGPTAIAFNATDAVVLAKALTKFAKDVPAMRFKGAMLNGQVVPTEQIQTIATLPSREELVSRLLYVLQSPMRGLATVLQANIRNLAVVIDQIGKQRSTTA